LSAADFSFREVVELAVALAELLLQLGLGGLGRRCLAQHLVAVHVADLQFLCLHAQRGRGHGQGGRQSCNREFH
jgi:hypothetical protein